MTMEWHRKEIHGMEMAWQWKWRGMSRKGNEMTWKGNARQGMTWHGMESEGKKRHGMERHDMTRKGKGKERKVLGLGLCFKE
jgi:hypothetical protein